MTDADIVNIFYLYIYKKKKNTTVQSYKDLSFDHRTGRRGGMLFPCWWESHLSYGMRRWWTGSKRHLTLRGGKNTLSSLRLDVPDTRKHHAFDQTDVTHISKMLPYFNPVSWGCWRRRSDTTQPEGIMTRQACWRIWPVARLSPFCEWHGDTLAVISGIRDIVYSGFKNIFVILLRS